MFLEWKQVLKAEPYISPNLKDMRNIRALTLFT